MPVLEDLAERIAHHAPDDGLTGTAVAGLSLMRWGSPSHPLYVTQPSCVAVLARGEKAMQLGDRELRYGPGQYLLTSIDLPATSRIVGASPAKPLLGLAIAIDPATLAEVTRRVPDVAPADGCAGVDVHDAGPMLLDAVLRLARLLELPTHAAALAPVIQQEILYWVLVGPGGARLLANARRDSPSHRVARAMETVRSELATPLRVETLARRVGMSPSSFHSHFKTICSMTPLQYQKQLRLQEARRLLVAEEMDVGSAAAAVGYESPSHFGKDYRRYFGRTPRDDRDALRRDGPRTRVDLYRPIDGPP